MISPIAQLSSAIRVKTVDVYGSGKVWWFSRQDQKGREAFACIDRRESSPTHNAAVRGQPTSKATEC